MTRIRSRHPFPDLTIYAEDEPPPVEQVRQALARGDYKRLAFDECAEPQQPAAVHPDARERGVELPLGFMPHRGENRRTRRAAVANWQPPQVTQKEGAVAEDPERSTSGVAAAAPATMPTRRELLKQHQRRKRGKLDVELRRLQRKAEKHARRRVAEGASGRPGAEPDRIPDGAPPGAGPAPHRAD